MQSLIRYCRCVDGSSSNTNTQKSNDLKPGMFVRVSQFSNDDEFGVVAYVVRANSSNGQVRLRVTSTSWRHMESKIRRGMISRSERIDDLETRRLALKSKQTRLSVRSRLSTKSNLSSYLFQRKFSWKQRPNTTTSLYKKLTHMRTLSGHQSYPIFCIAFDHSGNNVITGADDYLVKVWSSRTYINRTISLFLGCAIDRHVHSNTTGTGQLRYTCRGHKNVIVDVVVDQQDRFMASASQDKTIRVWHLNSERGTPAAILGGHTDMVNKLAFDFKHRVLVSCSDDGTCRVWNLS